MQQLPSTLFFQSPIQLPFVIQRQNQTPSLPILSVSSFVFDAVANKLCSFFQLDNINAFVIAFTSSRNFSIAVQVSSWLTSIVGNVTIAIFNYDAGT